MKCNEVKYRLIDYLDHPDQVEEQVRIEIENHLANCIACNEELRQVKDLDAKLYNIEKLEEPKGFRDSFIARLEKEKMNTERKTVSLKLNRRILQIAASILLLFAGSVIGYVIARNSKVAKLENEIIALKYSYTASVLNDQTASVKLKAISFVDDDKSLNPELIPVLANILNNDENVNVRLAAANALFKHYHNQQVNKLLIESLKTQTEPMIQIALINFLVENNEKQAIDNLKLLLESKHTNTIVKQYVNNGLKVLL